MMTMTRTLGGLILTFAAATGLGGLGNEARAQAFGFQYNGGGRQAVRPNSAGQFNGGGRFNGGPNFGFNYNRAPYIPAAAYGRQGPMVVPPRVYCPPVFVPPVYRASAMYPVPAPAYCVQPVQAYPAPAPYCVQPVQAYPASYGQGGTTVTVIVR